MAAWLRILLMPAHLPSIAMRQRASPIPLQRIHINSWRCRGANAAPYQLNDSYRLRLKWPRIAFATGRGTQCILPTRSNRQNATKAFELTSTCLSTRSPSLTGPPHGGVIVLDEPKKTTVFSFRAAAAMVARFVGGGSDTAAVVVHE